MLELVPFGNGSVSGMDETEGRPAMRSSVSQDRDGEGLGARGEGLCMNHSPTFTFNYA